LLLWFPLVAQAGDIDFSNYDVPLYTQIVDRIKAKVLLALAMVAYARAVFHNSVCVSRRENHPEFSHSFISVIRVFADNKPAKANSWLPTRQYKNWEFEVLYHQLATSTISSAIPHLCVFDGAGSRIFPEKNKCPVSIGRNFTLAETIKVAVDAKNAVAMWGPYEIKKAAFDLAVKRKRLLDGGTIKYRADDRLYQKDKVAISCFHAMQVWTSFSQRGDFSGRDSRCGASMERQEC
jgi:hypothetical protein